VSSPKPTGWNRQNHETNTKSGQALQPLRKPLKQFVALRLIKAQSRSSVMSEPLALSLGQKFELERMSRAIDATADLQTLQGIAKQLLQAWHSQKAATQWVMRQQLDAPSRFASGFGQQFPSEA
jgi:hypothetical protein